MITYLKNKITKKRTIKHKHIIIIKTIIKIKMYKNDCKRIQSIKCKGKKTSFAKYKKPNMRPQTQQRPHSDMQIEF